MASGRDELTGVDGWHEVLHAFHRHSSVITIEFDASSLRVARQPTTQCSSLTWLHESGGPACWRLAGDHRVHCRCQISVDTVDVLNLEIADGHT
jgi:hypothetical protein